MDWVKKNKDWLIALAVFLLFVIVLSITGQFLKGSKEEKPPIPVIEEEVKFDLPTESQNGTDEKNTTPPQTTSFFLHPSPTELLQKLENLDYNEFKSETKKLPGLKIMWPAYFFSILDTQAEKAQILLDASEDGFGVTMITEIDLNQYPQILKLTRGTKIWVAAEITGIDPTGTGQFFLNTEYVRFDDYKPRTSSPAAPENKEQ